MVVVTVVVAGVVVEVVGIVSESENCDELCEKYNNFWFLSSPHLIS